MRNVKKLKPHHEAFATLYAASSNSLDAFLKSHKHILKVEASRLLTSSDLWEKIIKLIKEKPVSEYHKTIVASYDAIKSKTGKSPFVIVEKYTSGYQSHKCADPIEVLGYLARAHHFFMILKRSYYMDKINKAIMDEMDYVNMMMPKNKNWEKEYLRMKKELQTDNINFQNLLQCQEDTGT